MLRVEMEVGSMVLGVASREISAMTAHELIVQFVESPSLVCAARITFLVENRYIDVDKSSSEQSLCTE